MEATAAPVVVGLDGDDLAVIRWAVAESRRLRRPMRVVHCWRMARVDAEAYVPADAASLMRSGAEALLNRARALIDDAAPELDAEFVAEYGVTADVLIRESLDAVGLVVGSDDVSWLGRVLGGEQSARVGREGRCPVTVIPERLVLGTGTGGVVVMVDGETSADGPLRYAFEQADSRDELLHVVHAVSSWPSTVALEEHEANLAEIIAGWQEQFPGVEVQRSTSVESVVDVCTDESAHAELLVLGHHHGRTGPMDVLHPVAASVLRTARCPVVLVPLHYGAVVATVQAQS